MFLKGLKSQDRGVFNVKDRKVNILGVQYEVLFRSEKDDARLKGVDGYCDHTVKKIVVDNWEEQEYNLEEISKHINDTVRHEMVHSFLTESGLMHCSWAKNEEMVDWVALQIPKMIKAMEFFI